MRNVSDRTLSPLLSESLSLIERPTANRQLIKLSSCGNKNYFYSSKDQTNYPPHCSISMTTNPGSSPEPPKAGHKLKITLAQGVIGAVSLAGTTAIPILVQRVLQPAPVVSPSPGSSVQAVPAIQSPDPTQAIGSSKQEEQEEKKGKKKGKKD
jgi:hypothetical protein